MQRCKTSTHTLQLLAHATENIRVKLNAKEVGVELDVFGAVARRQVWEGIDCHVRHWRRMGAACLLWMVGTRLCNLRATCER